MRMLTRSMVWCLPGMDRAVAHGFIAGASTWILTLVHMAMQVVAASMMCGEGKGGQVRMKKTAPDGSRACTCHVHGHDG